MYKVIVSIMMLVAPVLVVATSTKSIKRAPNSEAVKTLVCMTPETASNIDIRVEFSKASAIVKLINFGNDVSEAPTDGWGVEVSLEDANDLVTKGNAALAFYDKRALSPSAKVLALKNGVGFVALPDKKGNSVFPVSNCKVN